MRRWKRRYKIALVVLFLLVLVPFVAWFVVEAVVRAQLRRELARIEAAGESVDWTDFIPAPVPDEENAALVYEQALVLLDLDEDDTDVWLISGLDDDGPWTEKKRRDIAERIYWDLKDASIEEQFGWGRQRVPAESLPDLSLITEESAWRAARNRLAQNQAALDLLRKAAEMAHFRFAFNHAEPHNVGLPPGISYGISLVNLSAKVRQHDGDYEGAYKEVIRLAHLARLIWLPT